MSNKEGGGNRTVFRPSPLQGLNTPKPSQAPAPPADNNQTPPKPDWSAAPNPFSTAASRPDLRPQSFTPASHIQIPLLEDQIQGPGITPKVRNLLMAQATPVLAMAASMRAGRTRPALPQLHKTISQAISQFEQTIKPQVANDTYQKAKYALCSTVDDIVQNLPGFGNDTAEWARRSMVVTFFQENIGGDRFWQLVDEMLARPNGQHDLIELYHACLAAGFEGRFRIMPDGKRGLSDIMTRLYSVLEHPRSQSNHDIVPSWRGESAPMIKVNFWNLIALAAAVAVSALLLIYIILRLVLMQTGSNAWDSLSLLQPDQPLRLSREAPLASPTTSTQAERLRTLLAPEIAQGLITIDVNASTVRVRTTIGQLFTSGSDQLISGHTKLFSRIAEAINAEPGPVTIQGHADSDRVSSLSFPDNMALSGARAQSVARIFRSHLSDPQRVEVESLGDTRPIASNDTADGKALNRRVEIVIDRND